MLVIVVLTIKSWCDFVSSGIIFNYMHVSPSFHTPSQNPSNATRS